MTTRIFVRNLPPTLGEADFRTHFAAQPSVGENITDVRHLPYRRIGYVGYRSAADAAAAVKYFNRSYVRMSRIAVELARPVDDETLKEGKARKSKAAGWARTRGDEAEKAAEKGRKDSGKDGDKKRKREAFEEQDVLRGDKKFREFAEAMKPRSQTKTWANQDAAVLAQDDEVPTVPADSDDESVENDFSAIAKANKTGAKLPQEEEEEEEEEEEAQEEAEDVEDEVMEDAEDEEEATEKAPVSDADWLRSRTNRLLDMEEDVDEHLKKAIQKPKKAASTKRADAKEEEPAPEPMQEDRKEEQQEQNEDEGEANGNSTVDAAIKKVTETGRLFVRNLSYSATEEELKEHFSQYGKVEEVHIPVDKKSSNSKGFAYILFQDHSNAVEAFKSLDGTIYQGRLLHIIPASSKRETTLDEYTLSKLPLKQQRAIKRKQSAATSQFSWNSMYMNADAVMSSMASRLGVSKAELLDPSSSGAAVRQALAETHTINETKDYFKANGMDVAAFQKREKDDRIILLKNFPFGTKAEELRDMLTEFGELARLLVPPAGTIAVAEFRAAPHARAAFSALAYRRFKDTILFLEKGPVGLFTKAASTTSTISAVAAAPIKEAKPIVAELKAGAEPEPEGDTHTLFVRNLNFATTSERLTQVFSPIDGFLWARVKTKPDAKRPGQTLSMGFGFVEFRTGAAATAAQTAMDGYALDGHRLLVRVSTNRYSSTNDKYSKAGKANKTGSTKIIIKNLPFEANKKDVRELFGQFGQLRTVRVPKNFGGRTRGFAFAEYATRRDAEGAMQSLTDTHLLGRRLVLEFAEQDAEDAEEEIERMSKKVAKQRSVVEIARLRGARKKKIELDETGAVDTGE